MADIEERVEDVKAAATEAAEGARQVAQNLSEATERSVRDQPLTTLAAALVIGFVLGAVWKA